MRLSSTAWAEAASAGLTSPLISIFWLLACAIISRRLKPGVSATFVIFSRTRLLEPSKALSMALAAWALAGTISPVSLTFKAAALATISGSFAESAKAIISIITELLAPVRVSKMALAAGSSEGITMPVIPTPTVLALSISAISSAPVEVLATLVISRLIPVILFPFPSAALTVSSRASRLLAASAVLGSTVPATFTFPFFTLSAARSTFNCPSARPVTSSFTLVKLPKFTRAMTRSKLDCVRPAMPRLKLALLAGFWAAFKTALKLLSLRPTRLSFTPANSPETTFPRTCAKFC